MTRKLLAAALLVAAMAWAQPAGADTISFDPDGGGGAATITNALVFDWVPGSSLIVEHLDANGDPTGTATIYYQANLGTVQTATSPIGDYLNCSAGGTSCITAVAVMEVTLTPTGPNSVDFTVDSGVIKIYADTDIGNNLAGTGFALDPGATEILSASLVSGDGNFGFNNLTPVPLDSGIAPADGNNYPNIYTYSGTGATDLTALVNSFDSSYFTNLIANATLTFTNTSQIDPFNQANPSNAFSSNAIANGDLVGIDTGGAISVCGTGAGGFTCVNGTGNNIIAQSDANTSFQLNSTVPEPASLSLLGLGLAASAAARRRQMKKARK